MPAHDSMRVSDAERTEVADRLSKHFSDGRLDEAEFHERVDQAMRAKTRADFAGLFDDLPGEDAFAAGPPAASAPKPATAPANWPARRRLRHPILTVVLVIILVNVIAHAAVPWFFFGGPWLLIALVAFLFLRHHDRHHYHH